MPPNTEVGNPATAGGHRGVRNSNSKSNSESNPATAKSESNPPRSLLNWSLLDDPAVLEDCRASLRNKGAMVLRNICTPEGLEKLREEVLSAPYNESKQYYTPWQDLGDLERYGESHPRNFRTHSSAAFVGRKTLEECTRDRLCISIYDYGGDGEDDGDNEGRGVENEHEHENENETNRLLRFLSVVAGERLYQSEDENGSVYSYRIHSDHEPPWHFDESPYTAILYLQNPEGGGDFEYVPWCRSTTSKDDPSGHEIVERILMAAGTRDTNGTETDNNNNNENKNNSSSNNSPVQRIRIAPGSLLFFNGSRSFHRAAPIVGPTPRVGLVFTYGLRRGFSNSESVREANEWDPEDAAELLAVREE